MWVERGTGLASRAGGWWSASTGCWRSLRAAAMRRADLLWPAGLLVLILGASSYYLHVSGRGFALHHEDDAQYYLKIAENFARGRPFTFDGDERTNGFHPLWVLALQPLCAVIDDPEALVRAAFVLQYGLFVASAVVLYEVLRIVSGARGTAFCVALFYGLDNYFYKVVINGLETPLFVLLVLLALWWGLRRCGCVTGVGAASPGSLRGWVWFGLLLAALTLSRLDGGATHAVALGVGSALLTNRARLARFAALSAAAVAPVIAYALLSLGCAGDWLPISGRIKALRAAGGPPPSPLAVLDFPSLYNFEGTVARLPRVALLDRAADALDPGYRSYYMASNGLVLTGVGLSVAVYAAYLVVRRGRSKREPVGLALVTWFAVSAAVLVLVNKHLYGYRSELLAYWYPVSFSIAQLLMLAYVLGRVGLGRRPWMVAACAACMVGFGAYAWRVHGDRQAWLEKPHGYVAWHEAARWLHENTPSGARAAAFNAGILGHFSRRAVINLDGLVNSGWYFDHVLRASYERPAEYRDRLISYLRERRVEYFADHVPVGAPDCWRAHLGDGRGVTMTEVFRSAVSDGYYGVVYRLAFATARTSP